MKRRVKVGALELTWDGLLERIAEDLARRIAAYLPGQTPSTSLPIAPVDTRFYPAELEQADWRGIEETVHQVIR